MKSHLSGRQWPSRWLLVIGIILGVTVIWNVFVAPHQTPLVLRNYRAHAVTIESIGSSNGVSINQIQLMRRGSNEIEASHSSLPGRFLPGMELRVRVLFGDESASMKCTIKTEPGTRSACDVVVVGIYPTGMSCACDMVTVKF